MNVHHRRHKKSLLKESHLLLEYSRIKSRSGREYQNLWEVIDDAYLEGPLTEEKLNEAIKLFDWLANLGKNTIQQLKKWAKKLLSSQEYSEAESIGKDLTNQPIGNKVRNLWKNKDFKGAFKALSDHLSKSGQLAEQQQLNEFWTKLNKWWFNKDTSNTQRMAFMGPIIIAILAPLFLAGASGDLGNVDDQADKACQNQTNTELVQQANDAADGAVGQSSDNVQTDYTTVNFDGGIDFEMGTSNVDADGNAKLESMANSYADQIQKLLDAGATTVNVDADVAGGASNTGDGWNVDNEATGDQVGQDLRQNRVDNGSEVFDGHLQDALAERGIDSSQVNIKYNKNVLEKGAAEDVGQGEFDDNQNFVIDVELSGDFPDQTETPAEPGDVVTGYDYAPYNVKGPTADTPTPGVAKASRNLELRDLLYLGGMIAPVTFGDYKSDADMGRVDWRDIDVRGDKELEKNQKLAVWITNTRKAKLPILKRVQNALQGIIDIEFDGGKKYLGKVGTKYEPSTTTPLTQKRDMGPRGLPKYIKDPEGGYLPNPALTEADDVDYLWDPTKGEFIPKRGGGVVQSINARKTDDLVKSITRGKLPPEVNKQEEISPKIKSLQGNTTGMWKYILGNKAIGDIITSQVASEFDRNMKSFLEQLDLMYGKSGSRGNVNFRYRRNPNYEGSKYLDIPTEWNKKITGEPQTTDQSGDEEVYVQKQAWTGPYTETPSGEVIDLFPDQHPALQEQIKRIKQLMK